MASFFMCFFIDILFVVSRMRRMKEGALWQKNQMDIVRALLTH